MDQIPAPDDDDAEDERAYPVFEWMRANDVPLTREAYLEINYPDGVPEPWTAELDAGLPERFRIYS